MQLVKTILAGLIALQALAATAQQNGGLDVIVLDQVVVGDDTLPAIKLEPVEITGYHAPVEGLDYRMKYHTRKAYPYALRTARIVMEVNQQLSQLEGNRERRKYLNSTENLLKETFKDDIKNLTRTQGRILIKLIYRETGASVHDLLSEYRSNFKAGWWQFIAKRFDLDLKDVYDEAGEDRALEAYVQQLDYLYQRTGRTKEIYNEQLNLSVQDKRRKRQRSADETISGQGPDDR